MKYRTRTNYSERPEGPDVGTAGRRGIAFTRLQSCLTDTTHRSEAFLLRPAGYARLRATVRDWH